MLEAAHKAVEYIQGKTITDLKADSLDVQGLLRLLEIIGEAAKNISPSIRRSNPDIPWKEIAGTRDRLIHGYFDVDLGVVWNILQQDLPKLLRHLELLLKDFK